MCEMSSAKQGVPTHTLDGLKKALFPLEGQFKFYGRIEN